ncbi:hypothetical protein B0182_01380, partial [Moraxella bovis]
LKIDEFWTYVGNKKNRLWFKKYANKKTVRSKLGKPNGFPTRRHAQGERKTQFSILFGLLSITQSAL